MSKPKWISVTESLPQVNYTKLLFLSRGGISTGYLSKRRPYVKWTIHDQEEEDYEVTHWMNLPDDPS